MLAQNSNLTGTGEKVAECWESSVGQELAKLILFDMYMVTFSTGSENHSPLRSSEIVNCGEFLRPTVGLSYINLLIERNSSNPLKTT